MKILVFFVLSFFIIIYIIFGVRYDKVEKTFITKNVYLSFKFWDDKSVVNIDGIPCYPKDKKLNLFNMEDQCYNISYQGTNYVRCVQENSAYYDVFLHSYGMENLGNNISINDISNVSFLMFRDYSVENRVFSDPISNVFRYNEINFVKIGDKLKYCTDDFAVCKDLENIKGEIIGGNDDGLVFYDTGYVFLRLTPKK